MDGWVDGWMDGWMDGWVDEWIGGWMGGWVDEWSSRMEPILWNDRGEALTQPPMWMDLNPRCSERAADTGHALTGSVWIRQLHGGRPLISRNGGGGGGGRNNGGFIWRWQKCAGLCWSEGCTELSWR